MRAFVAVGLENRARRDIGAALRPLAETDSPDRWVRPENLHLTLAFLGEIADEALPMIDERLAPLAATVRGQALVLAGAGGFPRSRPHVLWLGLAEGADWFLGLATQVRAALGDVPGIELDRRAPSAHVTVARLRRPDRRPARLLEAALSGRTFRSRADAMTLYSSLLGPGGPTYRAELEWPFGAR